MDRAVLVGKRILLGVSGSIAAFKAVHLASQLTAAGAQVDVLMTPGATQFIAPLSFQAVTHRPVITSPLEMPAPEEIEHISLGHAADAMIVAPVTANIIAKLALGLAD